MMYSEYVIIYCDMTRTTQLVTNTSHVRLAIARLVSSSQKVPRLSIPECVVQRSAATFKGIGS